MTLENIAVLKALSSDLFNPDQEKAIQTEGLGKLKILQSFGIPAMIISFRPPYVAAFRQQNQVFYLAIVSIILLCFAIPLFYPSTAGLFPN